MGGTSVSWKTMLAALTDNDVAILREIVEQRLQELAEERKRHEQDKKELEEHKRKQLDDDHQKLHAIYQKLKGL